MILRIEFPLWPPLATSNQEQRMRLRLRRATAS